MKILIIPPNTRRVDTPPYKTRSTVERAMSFGPIKRIAQYYASDITSEEVYMPVPDNYISLKYEIWGSPAVNELGEISP